MNTFTLIFATLLSNFLTGFCQDAAKAFLETQLVPLHEAGENLPFLDYQAFFFVDVVKERAVIQMKGRVNQWMGLILGNYHMENSLAYSVWYDNSEPVLQRWILGTPQGETLDEVRGRMLNNITNKAVSIEDDYVTVTFSIPFEQLGFRFNIHTDNLKYAMASSDKPHFTYYHNIGRFGHWIGLQMKLPPTQEPTKEPTPQPTEAPIIPPTPKPTESPVVKQRNPSDNKNNPFLQETRFNPFKDAKASPLAHASTENPCKVDVIFVLDRSSNDYELCEIEANWIRNTMYRLADRNADKDLVNYMLITYDNCNTFMHNLFEDNWRSDIENSIDLCYDKRGMENKLGGRDCDQCLEAFSLAVSSFEGQSSGNKKLVVVLSNSECDKGLCEMYERDFSALNNGIGDGAIEVVSMHIGENKAVYQQFQCVSDLLDHSENPYDLFLNENIDRKLMRNVCEDGVISIPQMEFKTKNEIQKEFGAINVQKVPDAVKGMGEEGAIANNRQDFFNKRVGTKNAFFERLYKPPHSFNNNGEVFGQGNALSGANNGNNYGGDGYFEGGNDMHDMVGHIKNEMLDHRQQYYAMQDTIKHEFRRKENEYGYAYQGVSENNKRDFDYGYDGDHRNNTHGRRDNDYFAGDKNDYLDGDRNDYYFAAKNNTSVYDDRITDGHLLEDRHENGGYYARDSKGGNAYTRMQNGYQHGYRGGRRNNKKYEAVEPKENDQERFYYAQSANVPYATQDYGAQNTYDRMKNGYMDDIESGGKYKYGLDDVDHHGDAMKNHYFTQNSADYGFDEKSFYRSDDENKYFAVGGKHDLYGQENTHVYGSGKSDLYAHGSGKSDMYGHDDTHVYGSGKTDMYGQGDTHVYGSGKSDMYGQGDTHVYGSRKTDMYGQGDTHVYGSGKSELYGQGDTHVYGSSKKDMYGHDAEMYGQGDTHVYGSGKKDMYGHDAEMYGSGKADMYGQGDTHMYGSGKTDMYGQGDTHVYGSGKKDMYGQADTHMYGSGKSDLYGQGNNNVYGSGKSDMYG